MRNCYCRRRRHRYFLLIQLIWFASKELSFCLSLPYPLSILLRQKTICMRVVHAYDLFFSKYSTSRSVHFSFRFNCCQRSRITGFAVANFIPELFGAHFGCTCMYMQAHFACRFFVIGSFSIENANVFRFGRGSTRSHCFMHTHKTYTLCESCWTCNITCNINSTNASNMYRQSRRHDTLPCKYCASEILIILRRTSGPRRARNSKTSWQICKMHKIWSDGST